MSALIPDNVSLIRKMLLDNNRCTYQMIKNELNTEFATIHQIVYEKLHIKNSLSLDSPSFIMGTKKRSVLEPVKKPLNYLKVV